MYCPQCGTESPPALQYCRVCGANLKVIGKAVALSEAIARSDRGLLPKLKEMVKGLNVDHVTEEVSHAFDRMNQELAKMSCEEPPERHRERKSGNTPRNLLKRKKKTAAERREKHLTTGVVSLFSGAGLMIFLYFLSQVLVLRLPPNFIARVPFEIDPVVRIIWLFGLLPTLTGVGHILAGLMIRPRQDLELEEPLSPPRDLTEGVSAPIDSTPSSVPGQASVLAPASAQAPASVTERTTNLLEHNY